MEQKKIQKKKSKKNHIWPQKTQIGPIKAGRFDWPLGRFNIEVNRKKKTKNAIKKVSKENKNVIYIGQKV